MPVGAYNGPNVSTGNGVVTVFPYNFRILQQSHLRVAIGGVDQASGFTVDGINNPNGGNVTFAVAPANGAVVTRERNVPYTRSTDYQRGGAFDEETVDKDFDDREMQIQQLDDRVRRAPVLAPEQVGLAPLVLPAPVAGGYWRWKVDGTSIEYISVVDPQAQSANFVQSGIGAVVRSWTSKVGEAVSVTDFGAVGDGAFSAPNIAATGTDNFAAFMAAHDALPAYGGQILIPRSDTNIWRISAALNFTKPIRLTGQLPTAKADLFNTGTILAFNADKHGIILNGHNTLNETTVADFTHPGANHSIIENLTVVSLGGTAGVANGGTGINVDGIKIRAPSVTLRNVWAFLWRRNGIRIVASVGAGGATEGNANLWHLDHISSQLNGSDGLFLDGTDANAGVGIEVNCSGNTGFGIFDSSLLGNTYLACHTAANTGGAYKTDSGVGASLFLGCYQEGGQPASSLIFPTMVIGGNLSSAVSLTSTSTAYVLGGGLAHRAFYQHQNTKGAVSIGSSVGLDDTSLSAFTFGTSVESGTFDAWKLKFDNTNKAWFLQFANSASFEPIAFINSAHARTAVGNGPILGSSGNDGYYIGSRSAPILRGFAAAAPVAGAYVVGDIVYNNAPVAGGTIGFVCVTAGSPGTWKTFGAIAA